uniref:Glycosyltransferase family 4 protein n=1 Tax=Roseihalotalea indica TaxID=2867963 RepID=A0AA49GIN7_9BACT|nr:glycosyltransferase family 4 protein [Tunicatimonas sp. TK19036]
MKIVIISLVPAPYRNPVFERINKKFGNNFTVIYCTQTEPLRGWKYEISTYNHIYLKDNYKENTRRDKRLFVHNNLDVWGHLLRIKPDVVISCGFNPTHLYGWLYTVLFRKKHIVWIEGWKMIDDRLTSTHIWVRKMVYKYTQAYIGPGERTAESYRSYGAKDKQIFYSPLFADAEKFNQYIPWQDRQYDLMFSGQLYQRKMPLFFAEVAKQVHKVFPKLKVLVAGDGPDKDKMLAILDSANVAYEFPGFLPYEELPHYYASSKIFLFPTELDAWGTVANEALATGTPVITTPYAGVADDLVKSDENGYVLEAEVNKWADKIIALLSDQNMWQRFSDASRETLTHFNQEKAAQGIIDACYYVLNASPQKKQYQS